MDNELHPRTHLFIIRLWLEELGNGKTEWRGQVKHVMSGEVRYFREWKTLLAFLREVLMKMRIRTTSVQALLMKEMITMTVETQTQELEQQRHAMPEKTYTEICENIRALDSNSFKLLSFVPLVSGSAIMAVFLKGEAGISWITILFSLAGALVTFGLYRWEFRNIQICKWLQKCAIEIERNQFGVEEGKEQFAIRMQKNPPKFMNPDFDTLHMLLGIPITQRTAEHIIYWTTIIAWLLLPLAVLLT